MKNEIVQQIIDTFFSVIYYIGLLPIRIIRILPTPMKYAIIICCLLVAVVMAYILVAYRDRIFSVVCH